MNLPDPTREPSVASKSSTRKKIAWIVGIVAAVIIIASASFATVQNAKYTSKIDSMKALANRVVPESDWTGGKTIVTGDSSCISFDQDCYTLFRNWEAQQPVEIEKMAEQLGIPMEHTHYPEGCMISSNDGGKTEICAYESSSLGNWQVSLRIRER